MTPPGAQTPDQPDDFAGRIVLVVDDGVSITVQDACAELASALADRVGMPVTLAMIPIDAVDAVRPLTAASGGRVQELVPTRPLTAAPMSAAPFLWRGDGRPDWGAMWTSFCELALYGGPPHRGPDTPLRAPVGGAAAADSPADMISEMQRGIWETTGLYAEPSGHGWLAVTCDGPKMAAWLCATIILENVDARVDEDRLLLPAGPDYRLENEVKSIITVLAKTHHYWQAHVSSGGPTSVADFGR
jgi:hypothetical protein